MTMMALAINLLCLVSIQPMFTPLKAQSFYGSIVGAVTDNSGAIVPGAKVTATNSGTNAAVSVVTDAKGEFSFANLVPAVYKLEVTASNFKRFIRDQVTVEVGSVVRVDSALEVGVA